MKFREGQIDPGKAVELTEKQEKARRQRNVAIAVGLFFMVGVFYIASVAKFTPAMMLKKTQSQAQKSIPVAPTETAPKE